MHIQTLDSRLQGSKDASSGGRLIRQAIPLEDPSSDVSDDIYIYAGWQVWLSQIEVAMGSLDCDKNNYEPQGQLPHR